jgi:hypothetical protein
VCRLTASNDRLLYVLASQRLGSVWWRTEPVQYPLDEGDAQSDTELGAPNWSGPVRPIDNLDLQLSKEGSNDS